MRNNNPMIMIHSLSKLPLMSRSIFLKWRLSFLEDKRKIKYVCDIKPGYIFFQKGKHTGIIFRVLGQGRENE